MVQDEGRLLPALLAGAAVTGILALIGAFVGQEGGGEKISHGTIRRFLEGKPIARQLNPAERKLALEMMGLRDEARGIPQKPLGRAHREFVRHCLSTAGGGSQGMIRCAAAWAEKKAEIGEQLAISREKEQAEVDDADRRIAIAVLEDLKNKPGADRKSIEATLESVQAKALARR